MEYYMNRDGQVASKDEWKIQIEHRNMRVGNNLSFDDVVDLGMLSFLREEYQEIFNQGE